MLKSAAASFPASTNHLVQSSPKPAEPLQDASSCDADDEEIQDYNNDQPLDFSCKSKKEETLKRPRCSSEEEESDVPAVTSTVDPAAPDHVPAGKRKHLRKKRRKAGSSVARPSVISYASGTTVSDSESTSSSVEGEEARRMRKYRRFKSSRAFNMTGFVDSNPQNFDVDEHFRRSLGDAYEKLTAGNTSKTSSSSVLIVQDSIKPETVDDHFAKALGSETWSKIVKNNTTPPPGPTTTPPLHALPLQQPPPPLTSTKKPNSSREFSIEKLLGTNSSNNQDQSGGEREHL